MKKIILASVIAITGTLLNAAEEDIAGAIAAQNDIIAQAKAEAAPGKLFPGMAIARAASAGDEAAQKADETIRKAKENIRRIKKGQDILK